MINLFLKDNCVFIFKSFYTILTILLYGVFDHVISPITTGNPEKFLVIINIIIVVVVIIIIICIVIVQFHRGRKGFAWKILSYTQ